MNKRDAYGLGIALAILCGGAQAQGFVDEPTCYSWEGGHKSAGSFSKCTRWEIAKAPAPAPAPAVVAAPVVQSQVCPPQITVIPEPKRKPIVKKKPAPLKC